MQSQHVLHRYTRTLCKLEDLACLRITFAVHSPIAFDQPTMTRYLYPFISSTHRWDLRDPRGVVNTTPVVNYDDGKDYSKGTGFTCMATSGDGFVVVGSKVRRKGGLQQQSASWEATWRLPT